MSFVWTDFFLSHSIPFSPAGGAWLKTHCPFCGSEDRGLHQNVHPAGGFHCWRNAEHRGRTPTRLVQALLSCSFEEAAALTGDSGKAFPDDSEFSGMLSDLAGRPALEEKLGLLSFPKEIRLVGPDGYMFHRYLQGRGYTEEEAVDVCKDYGLRCALQGPFRYRLVLPTVHPQGLVSWAGRSIIPGVAPRYKGLAHDLAKSRSERLPQALVPLHGCLFNAVAMPTGGEHLVVVEGPMDALNVDFRGRAYGIRSVCLFGKSLGEGQASLLAEHSRRFQHCWLLLDEDATFDALALVEKLAHLGFKTKAMPPRFKDPAMLSTTAVGKLFHG